MSLVLRAGLFWSPAVQHLLPAGCPLSSGHLNTSDVVQLWQMQLHLLARHVTCLPAHTSLQYSNLPAADCVCARVPGGGADWGAPGEAARMCAPTSQVACAAFGGGRAALLAHACSGRDSCRPVVAVVPPTLDPSCPPQLLLACRPTVLRSSTWLRRRGEAGCRATAPSCLPCAWPRPAPRWRGATRCAACCGGLGREGQCGV